MWSIRYVARAAAAVIVSLRVCFQHLKYLKFCVIYWDIDIWYFCWCDFQGCCVVDIVSFQRVYKQSSRKNTINNISLLYLFSNSAINNKQMNLRFIFAPSLFYLLHASKVFCVVFWNFCRSSRWKMNFFCFYYVIGKQK